MIVRPFRAFRTPFKNGASIVLVYRPQDADVVLMVQSRPSEDLLAVYDAKGWPRTNFLWRTMGRQGLQQGETPLVTQFQKAFDALKK